MLFDSFRGEKRKKKERKEQKEKKQRIDNSSGSDSTSSQTLERSINLEAIRIKMSLDKEFRKMIIEFGNKQEASVQGRGNKE